MTLLDDAALRGGIKTIAGRVLKAAHPMAWLLLLAIGLFFLQPFRYSPKFLASFILRYALFVPALLWLSAALLLLLARWAGVISKRETQGVVPSVRTAVLTSRLGIPEFWRDFFWCYAGIFLILACHFLVKVSIHAINPRLFDPVLVVYDRWLFLGHDPVRFFLGLAQSSPVLLHIIDFIYNAVYYFTFTVSVPALALLIPRRHDRLSFSISYCLIWILGGAMYLAFPSWGPAFCDHRLFQEALRHMPTVSYVQGAMAQALTQLLDDPYGPRSLAFGGVAAFPSLHLAVMTVFTMISMRVSKVLGGLFLTITACMFVGSMVTGYHYFSDGLVGIILGVGSTLGGRRWASAFLRDDQCGPAGQT